MKELNLNSKFIQSLNALTDLLLLNLLWMLTSMPIVTAGASTAAVYGVLDRLDRRECDGVVRCYFRCWLGVWKQAGLFGLIQLLFTGLLLNNFLTMYCQPNRVAVLLAWLSLIAMIILSGVFTLIYPLLARDQNWFADQLRNAALLFRANVARVLLQLLLLALPAAMAFFLTELFLRTLPFWVLFGFSALFRLCHGLQRPIFRAFEPEQSQNEDVELQ